MNIPNLWRTRRQRYQLCSTYCVRCRAVFFPPRPFCPKCRSISVPGLDEATMLLFDTPHARLYAEFEWTRQYTVRLLPSVQPRSDAAAFQIHATAESVNQ